MCLNSSSRGNGYNKKNVLRCLQNYCFIDFANSVFNLVCKKIHDRTLFYIIVIIWLREHIHLPNIIYE